MDIETKKNFNKLKHYLTLFDHRDNMWIFCEIDRPKLYFINNPHRLSLIWI